MTKEPGPFEKSFLDTRTNDFAKYIAEKILGDAVINGYVEINLANLVLDDK